MGNQLAGSTTIRYTADTRQASFLLASLVIIMLLIPHHVRAQENPLQRLMRANTVTNTGPAQPQGQAQMPAAQGGFAANVDSGYASKAYGSNYASPLSLASQKAVQEHNSIQSVESRVVPVAAGVPASKSNFAYENQYRQPAQQIAYSAPMDNNRLQEASRQSEIAVVINPAPKPAAPAYVPKQEGNSLQAISNTIERASEAVAMTAKPTLREVVAQPKFNDIAPTIESAKTSEGIAPQAHSPAADMVVAAPAMESTAE
jgi:hypothetical protein